MRALEVGRPWMCVRERFTGLLDVPRERGTDRDRWGPMSLDSCPSGGHRNGMRCSKKTEEPRRQRPFRFFLNSRRARMREEEEIGFEIGEHSVLRARLFLMGIIKVSGSNTDGVPVSDQLYISFYFKEQMKRYINQKVRIL